MARKYFYSHIVTTEDISLSIADLDMPNEDRVKLISLVHENLHHIILDNMLDRLSEEDKKELLLHISADDHEKAWIILKNKVKNVEDIISKIAQDFKEEVHSDIKKASK